MAVRECGDRAGSQVRRAKESLGLQARARPRDAKEQRSVWSLESDDRGQSGEDKPSQKLKSASGQWVNSQVSSSVEGRIEMRTSRKQGSAFLRPMLPAGIVGEIRTSPGGSREHEVETLVNEAGS